MVKLSLHPLVCALMVASTALGKLLVENWYNISGSCWCPTNGIHNNLNCSLFCVSQATCAAQMPGNNLCYLISEPTGESCGAGVTVLDYCLVLGLTSQIPPADEWCHRVHNPTKQGGSAFDYEAQYLESGMSDISLIRIGYGTTQGSAVTAIEMTFGDSVVAVDGSLGENVGECALASGEFVNAIHMETEIFWGSHFPVSLTINTSQKVCGPFGREGLNGSFTYSGTRLLYIKGRKGNFFDQLEFVFAWC